MAYVDGQEVLFSADINITEGSGGAKEYSANEIYNNGDIVIYNGLIYTPKANGIKGILPTDATAWEDLTSGKQDKLPENDSGSSHRIVIQSPLGRKDENGNDIFGFQISKDKYNELKEYFPQCVEEKEGKYYWVSQWSLKRIGGYDGETKDSSNGRTGVITRGNRDAKLAEGLISQYGYDNYVDHHEPNITSIVCRDSLGRTVTEDGEEPFHAVNKRQLEKATNTVLTYKNTKIKDITTGQAGWYRIAKVNNQGSIQFPTSAIFKIMYNYNYGAVWDNLIISVTTLMTKEPSIAILNHTHGMYDEIGIPKMRIVYGNGGIYLDIYSNKKTTIKDDAVIDIQVSLYGDHTIWRNANEKWSLIDAVLVGEAVNTSLNEQIYEKSTTDTVLADIDVTDLINRDYLFSCLRAYSPLECGYVEVVGRVEADTSLILPAARHYKVDFKLGSGWYAKSEDEYHSDWSISNLNIKAQLAPKSPIVINGGAFECEVLKKEFRGDDVSTLDIHSAAIEIVDNGSGAQVYLTLHMSICVSIVESNGSDELVSSYYYCDDIGVFEMQTTEAYIPKTPEYAHLFPASYTLRRERTEFELIAEELRANKDKA